MREAIIGEWEEITEAEVLEFVDTMPTELFNVFASLIFCPCWLSQFFHSSDDYYLQN